MTYRLFPRLTAGVEYNPRAGEIGPLVNFVALTEGETRPALILGTSSDRIGTPRGRSYYATLSKDLTEATRLPVAPYLGASYGTYEHRLRPIGGINVHLGDRWTAVFIHDGIHAHPTVTFDAGKGIQLSAIFVRARDWGLSASLSF